MKMERASTHTKYTTYNSEFVEYDFPSLFLFVLRSSIRQRPYGAWTVCQLVSHGGVGGGCACVSNVWYTLFVLFIPF